MEAIINPDELMDEVREQIPSVELTEGLIHEFKKITGPGQDAVENVDKRSTTDSADAKQSITIKPAKVDEVSTKPVDGSQPVSEEVKKESDDKVIDVPAYKALSQAEFDATVKQMAYTVVKQSFGHKVNRSVNDYKPENMTREDIDKFLKVLIKPPKEHRNANIDELIELVEGENVKQFLKGFRGHRNPFHP
jgi:cell division septation protein DedD